jgi:hypothetical protein
LLTATTVYVRFSEEHAPLEIPLIVPTVAGNVVLVTDLVRAALVPEQLEETTVTLPETKAAVNSIITLKLPWPDTMLALAGAVHV